jgi:predicted  nucleic acid-binding Zn-ribbon protein
VDPLAIGAFLVAIAALVFTAINTRRGAQQSYVQQLEARLAMAEADVARCAEAKDRQREELDSANRELSRLHRDLEMAFIEIHELQRKYGRTYSIEELQALMGRLDVPPTGP